MRFSDCARDGEAKDSETSAERSAMQASRSFEVGFMVIFVLEETISSPMLLPGAERDLNETRRTEGEAARADKAYPRGSWRHSGRSGKSLSLSRQRTGRPITAASPPRDRAEISYENNQVNSKYWRLFLWK